MNFQTLKQSIIDNVLMPAESGRYITVGNQRQRESAEVINANNQVALYFSEGDFPKSGSQIYGDVKHNPAFNVELTIAAQAEGDLSVLNDENATENEKAKAIRAFSEASVLADEKMDELISVVWNVLMDARNEQMGINAPADNPNLKRVANRWIDKVSKDTPSADGDFFVLTASMRLTCTIEETIEGEDLKATPAGGAVYDADIDLKDDDTTKQGVKQTTL